VELHHDLDSVPDRTTNLLERLQRRFQLSGPDEHAFVLDRGRIERFGTDYL
jgi:hypothetical protein